MKLRNKKTGKVTTNYDLLALQGVDIDKGINRICLQTEEGDKYAYSSLADFNAEWEDYEEPKVYYYISDFGAIRECEIGKYPLDEEDRKQIGNYFLSLEETAKAGEKLEAWQRLKNKGFRFNGYGRIRYAGYGECEYSPHIDFTIPELDKDEPYHYPDEVQKDLDILFGGEE